MKAFLRKMNAFVLLAVMICSTGPAAVSADWFWPVDDPVNESTIPALSDLVLINRPGFTDRLNRYAWSMTVFKDELYVGTWNTLGFYIREPSNGAQVFRYVDGIAWDQVVDAGLYNKNNQGLRTMVVWDDPDDAPDKGPAIYGTTMNAEDGLEVWRTFDGDNWEVVVGDGSPYPNGFYAGPENDSGRGMQVYECEGTEWIYLGTRGYHGGELWRTDDGVTWEKVTDALSLGLGSGSIAMATMCVYRDDPQMPPALFVGTWGLGGFNVVKTYDGLHFETVAHRGLNRRTSQGVAKLIVFDGKLWLLGINYVYGFEIYTAGPGRIDGDEDWETVATDGLTDKNNLYAWNAIVYDNGTGPRLYIGTFNNKKGFFLYSMTSDLKYAVEVGPDAPFPSGMGDVRRYGARSFAIYDGRLIMGLACIYAPTQIWMGW
ncbi:MAG: hypothetical protein SWH61_11695 [Thermodesulfobacteriota bacterium]|nr:hypothetical protein [Thermodesulfobacteriota bacterium]